MTPDERLQSRIDIYIYIYLTAGSIIDEGKAETMRAMLDSVEKYGWYT